MGYRWCSYYNCFCDDAREIIDDDDYCDFDCSDCEESEDVQ